MSNPFNCNCHLAWFSDWLRVNDVTSGSPRCHRPSRLQDSPVDEISVHEFTCTSESPLPPRPYPSKPTWALAF